MADTGGRWPPSRDNRPCFQRIRFDTKRNSMLEQHGFYLLLRIRGESSDGDALLGIAQFIAPLLVIFIEFP